jgi:CRISPR-associated endonuclease/helicase Cas3
MNATLQGVQSGCLLRHEDCWAKTTRDGNPGISVRDHCLNVGCVADVLISLLPEQLHKQIPQGASVLAALHDIGKVSPGFQIKCPAWLAQYSLTEQALKEGWAVRLSDHAKITQSTLQSLLAKSSLQRWAAAVGAHHGRIKGERVDVREPWEEERVRLATEVINTFGPLPDRPPTEADLWFVAGLTTVADWIGSDEQNFPQDVLLTSQERTELARTALANINWQPVRIRELHSLSDLFPEIKKANDLQSTAMQVICEPGVYVIEGAMGCGKTEAAIAAAYGLIAGGAATGFYFALPTQTTSNRIHLRLGPFVERIAMDPLELRLAHSSSWLFDENPPKLFPANTRDSEAQEHARAGISWFASAKRSLLARCGVGTIDQALLGIVAAKHFFVRQLGLAGKVVILDEIHTYDLYTGTLITQLVKRLRELHSTVIILSATLTESRRRELLGVPENQPLSSAYPLVSGVADGFIERECPSPASKLIHIRHCHSQVSIDEVLKRASAGDCVLWIRNTVDEAQQTFRALQTATAVGGPAIALLHSRFPYFRREQIEAEWMNKLGKDSVDRPNGCVLVSTQVAEQSVDLDSDLLITDHAPTDMLLQRIGRLWRHERGSRPCPRPEVWIQLPDLNDNALRCSDAKVLRQALGKSARVYAPYVLLRSLQQWSTRLSLMLPEDIRDLLESTYANAASDEPPAWTELRHELEKQKDRMAMKALNATSVWTIPALNDEEGVQTRWNTYPAAQLLLVAQVMPLRSQGVHAVLLDGSEIKANERGWSFDVAKAIHRNLVRIPLWVIAKSRPAAARGGQPPVLRLEDYHTVLDTRHASGTPNKDAVVTRRQYLLDARFGVILSGDHGLLESAAASLQNPIWGVWLGRKSCIPAEMVYRGLFGTEIEAQRELIGEKSIGNFTVVAEVDAFDQGTDSISDQPVRFGNAESSGPEGRQYTVRRIAVRSGARTA